MVYKIAFKIVVWFVIAIARFRFPLNESIPTVIRRRYGGNVVKLIRKFERLDCKLRKAELDLNFLDKCVELSLIPKFLNFKVSNHHLRNSSAYNLCRRTLLLEEITHKTNSITEHNKELQRIKDELQLVMNCVDFAHVLSCFLQSNDTYIENHRMIQDKKLCSLIEKNQTLHNDPS